MEADSPQHDQRPRRIVLATVDDGRFGELAHSRLAAEGWEPVLASAPEDVFSRLEGGEVAALLLDFSLPQAHDILARLKLDPRTNSVPVVALFPRGTTPMRPRTLRVQGDLELSEPCEVSKLLEALIRQAEARATAGWSLRFLVPSSGEGLKSASDIFAEVLATSGLDEPDQTSFLAACREAVANAIEHGNGSDAARVVRVACCGDDAAVTVEVRDEGDGFDAAAYLEKARQLDPADAARDRSRQGGQGGLGIMMMFRFTDGLRYNDRGNVVTLVKRLKGARG